MKFSVVFSVFVFVCGVQTQYEDDPCLGYDGSSGTCKKLEECPSALEQVKKFRRHDKNRCGFSGSNEIVCCNDFPSPGGSTDDSSVWETGDPTAVTTLNKGGVTPAVTRKGQRKSEVVCDEYSNEVPLALEFHILGGEDATAGEFPHMCSLGYTTEEGISWQCGGSLISDRFVMTAAHCVINPDNLRPTKVRMGMVSLNGGTAGDTKNPPPEEFDVENITVHPSFVRRTSANDIALIRLNRQVKYNNFIHPACLYNKLDDPIGLLVTGWGYIDNQGSDRSDILQKAPLQAVSLDRCNATYIKRSRRLSNNQLCAGSATGKQDSCRGDSGGPLQVRKDSVYAIVGVISFGIGCGGNVPAVYTRVASYLDWIEPIVWPGSK